MSVVSFYFGSSTTASAVGAGMKALKGDTPPPNINTNKTWDGNKPPDLNKPTHQGAAKGPAV